MSETIGSGVWIDPDPEIPMKAYRMKEGFIIDKTTGEVIYCKVMNINDTYVAVQSQDAPEVHLEKLELTLNDNPHMLESLKNNGSAILQ